MTKFMNTCVTRFLSSNKILNKKHTLSRTVSHHGLTQTHRMLTAKKHILFSTVPHHGLTEKTLIENLSEEQICNDGWK
jgi:hypothetical protein